MNAANEPKVIDQGWKDPTGKVDQEESQAVEDLSAHKNKETMMVKVASPFNDYFNGSAFSISAVNATGPFDILPGHHNFISLLEPCTITVRDASGKEQSVDIGGGLIHVKADRVNVFLDV